MFFKELPPVKREKPLDLSHFPNMFYAEVFRLWVTKPRVSKEACGFSLSKEEKSVDKKLARMLK